MTMCCRYYLRNYLRRALLFPCAGAESAKHFRPADVRRLVLGNIPVPLPQAVTKPLLQEPVDMPSFIQRILHAVTIVPGGTLAPRTSTTQYFRQTRVVIETHLQIRRRKPAEFIGKLIGQLECCGVLASFEYLKMQIERACHTGDATVRQWLPVQFGGGEF